ncbi:hypothetical protein [Pseudoflavonifractor sp. 60]|uniref:hypothetical protein n=1 Tax=Pseudoflavonifractor sp. 60 TaxID=2304576 RepID=UPI00136CF90D|nr:hypothetical protein [Pseudoflavonifractor sp. 60]
MSKLLPLGKSERYGACDGVTTLRSYDSCANSGLQYPPSPGARGKCGEFDSS